MSVHVCLCVDLLHRVQLICYQNMINLNACLDLLHQDMMAVLLVTAVAVDLVPVWGMWACLCVAS